MAYAQTAGRYTSTYHRPAKKSGYYHDNDNRNHLHHDTSRHYKDYSNCAKFYVKPLDTSDTFYYEALLLESGSVLIGTDVFRLIIHDTPSHKINIFRNMDAVLEKYRIVERKYY